MHSNGSFQPAQIPGVPEAAGSRPKGRFLALPPANEAQMQIYQLAMRENETRFGQSAARELNWRRMALLSISVAMLSIGLNFHLAGKAKTIPYIVEVDRTGGAVARGPAAALPDQKPSEAFIRSQLAKFVENLRTVSSDPAMTRKALREAWNLSQGPAYTALERYVQSADPYGRGDRERVRAEVTSVLAATDNTWSVDWKETVTDREGQETSTSSWRGSFVIFQRPAGAEISEDDLVANPMGLFVQEFDLKKLE